MPPNLAAFLTIAFMAWLFWRDFREKHNVTSALWIPFSWLFLIASRPTTHWLAALGLPAFGGSTVEEGSSLDAVVYATLIASGIYVLSRRHVDLARVIRGNQWLTVFVLYCLVAIVWSEFPIVSAKRWVKVLGHPVMVLIIFTEPVMKESLATMLKRCAYIVFPVSILWMKYFPKLGRTPSEWGSLNNCGIAEGKNELGSLGLIFGLFVVWYGLQLLRSEKSKYRGRELRLTAGLALLIAYCLLKAHSSTSLIAFMISATVMVALGLRLVNKRIIGVYAVAAIILLGVAQLTFDIYGDVVDMSGHGLTIAGRARLWKYLLQTDESPIFGTGFESFWLGSRVQKIWEMHEFRWKPTQAHNGYVETYINLGIVGLIILVALLVATFRKCRRDLLTDFQWGRLTMSYFIAIVLHNWTEAGFKGLSLYLLTLFLVALNYSHRAFSMGVSEPHDEEADLTYSGREAWGQQAASSGSFGGFIC